MHDHSLVSDYIFDELSFVSKFTFSDPDDYHSSISEKYLEYDCCCSCYNVFDLIIGCASLPWSNI